MNFRKTLIKSGLIVLTLGITLQASELPTFVQFARPLAMGGAFTAVADDNNLFAYNPAGLVQRTGGEFTLLELMGGVSQDAREVLKWVGDNKDALQNFDEQPPDVQAKLVNDIRTDIAKLNPRVFASADIASYLSGPTIWGLHYGFGALGSTDDCFKIDAPLEVPTISYFFNTDVMVPVTVAKRWDKLFIPGKFGIGATAKFIRRYQVMRVNQSVAELDEIETPPMSEGKAFGGDLGLLYQPTNRTNIGLMAEDIGGTKMKFQALEAKKGFPALPERDTVIRPRWNLGYAMVPDKLLFLIPTRDRWTFSMDINDIAPPDEHVVFQNGVNKAVGSNLYTHLHFGAEFRYWFMRFRGGINQGYPTAGLGIDIPVLKIEYAYFVRELGEYAGDVKEVNHAISLALKFGSGNTESRERIANLKKSKEQNVGIPENQKPAAQNQPPVNAAPAPSASSAASTPATAAPAAAAPAAATSDKTAPPAKEKKPEVKQDIPK